MGIEEMARNLKVIPKIREDIVDSSVRSAHGPKAYMILEWNRSTKECFDKGRKPRQGRRYAFKCERFDGSRAYFVLEQI